ncbi:MAG: sulfatase-like hydrolase/transferase [Lentisphaerales bacterium]|nr:sulfatase-like hydrolase/transferase [Lentisphaerales bacterium]
MTKSSSAIIALVLLALITSFASASTSRPNVLLILTDNQAYNELTCKGHPVVQTPHIDKFSKEGIDFTNFHAPAYCSPSRAALMTGRHPLRYGIHNTIGGVSILHKSEKTLADFFKAAGYKTAIFGKWHLGMSHPYAPRFRGFEEAFIHGGGGIGQLEDAHGNNHIDANYWHNGKLVPSQGYSTDILFDNAINYIEKNKDKPFFCFVSTPATHAPYQEHPEVAKRIRKRGIEKGNIALYSMIENIDDCVGRILKKLDDLKVTENTIVIIATDQGSLSRYRNTQPEDLQSRVFCIMRYPKLIKQSTQNNALTGMIDVVPTLLDICGLEVPENMDGRSLRPLLTGVHKWQDERMIILQCPRSRHRSKWKNAKLITPNYFMDMSKRLYDRNNKLADVSEQKPEAHKQTLKTYDDFWNSLKPESDLLCRHEIGPNPTRLCAMDWYKEAAPWNSKSQRNKKGYGSWAVEVSRDGRYRVELAHYSLEAKKAIEATAVDLKIGDSKATARMKISDYSAIVELNLKAGTYDMEALFCDEKGNKWGCLFAYITLTK